MPSCSKHQSSSTQQSSRSGSSHSGSSRVHGLTGVPGMGSGTAAPTITVTPVISSTTARRRPQFGTYLEVPKSDRLGSSRHPSSGESRHLTGGSRNGSSSHSHHSSSAHHSSSGHHSSSSHHSSSGRRSSSGSHSSLAIVPCSSNNHSAQSSSQALIPSRTPTSQSMPFSMIGRQSGAPSRPSNGGSHEICYEYVSVRYSYSERRN